MGNQIRLLDVYNPEFHRDAVAFLYLLIRDVPRKPGASCDEKSRYAAHIKHVESHPYQHWYVVMNGNGDPVGSVYMTPFNVLHVALAKTARKRGLGRAAIEAIMALHPKKTFYANIRPRNFQAIAIFERLGFQQTQISYKLETSGDSNV